LINFDPNFTELLFFDVEGYVPTADREKEGKSSLIYNASKPGHFLLGGVFRRMFPIRGELDLAFGVWNFAPQQEKSTLMEIFEYFNKSWEIIEKRNRKKHPDLILVGTGISRLDLPALFVRSKFHDVASEDELYEVYLKAKVIDLGNVGIPLFKKTPQIYPLYPKTNDELLGELGVNKHKKSGMRVWDMYDRGDFEGIKARTASEVEDAIEIANRIIDRCRS
jgi:hypothetical protein